MPLLDDTDREILSILRADARTPVAVLAQRLRHCPWYGAGAVAQARRGRVITGFHRAAAA